MWTGVYTQSLTTDPVKKDEDPTTSGSRVGVGGPRRTRESFNLCPTPFPCHTIRRGGLRPQGVVWWVLPSVNGSLRQTFSGPHIPRHSYVTTPATSVLLPLCESDASSERRKVPDTRRVLWGGVPDAVVEGEEVPKQLYTEGPLRRVWGNKFSHGGGGGRGGHGVDGEKGPGLGTTWDIKSISDR